MVTNTDPRARSGALYRLLAWLSPSFPTGAFSYSDGLEAAAASGAVHDRVSLETWTAAIVAHGSGRIDADILRDAHRAASERDEAALDAANRRGAAYRATAELALESMQQGNAFLTTCLAAWTDPFLQVWAAPHFDPLAASGERENSAPPRPPAPCPASGERVPEGDSARAGEGLFAGEGVCLPAAFGAAAARAGIALEDALLGFLQAFAANLISAGLRLGIVGQTDGQRILAALEPVVTAAARAAPGRGAADFGSAAFAADLASMAHETQYSRLFRS